MNKIPLYFPPLSAIVFVVLSLLFIYDSFFLIDETQQNTLSIILKPYNRKMLSLTLVLFLFVDFYWYLIRRRKIRRLFELREEELELAWRQKAKQQERANEYSGQKDKLKGFISDKLLTFMEHDEKFVHFKGIASEVRHNGVISYDKVTSALRKAIEQQGFLAIYEKNQISEGASDLVNREQSISSQTLDSLSLYENAQDAMEYLWALLDLSTADNMALHIGKQLIECEEHYFQLHLDAKKEMDITQSIPSSPTFYPQLSLLLTLSLQVDEPEIRRLISLAKINHNILSEPLEFENDSIKLTIQPTPEILGNPNHVILLLENLIKNALFFQRKSTFKQSSDKVVIAMKHMNNVVKVTIYNRGPRIEQDDLEHIFDLGFSTRRSRQNNGKGLGLFFSKQIVDGYQGTIEANNVSENQSILELQISLESGELKSFKVESVPTESGLMVSYDNDEELQEHLSVNFDTPISGVKILAMKNCENTIGTEEEKSIENIELFVQKDTDNKRYQTEKLINNTENIPCWKVHVSGSNKKAKMKISPLSKSGVNFIVEIPTAESLLDQ